MTDDAMELARKAADAIYGYRNSYHYRELVRIILPILREADAAGYRRGIDDAILIAQEERDEWESGSPELACDNIAQSLRAIAGAGENRE